jgi:hypothetical protein
MTQSQLINILSLAILSLLDFLQNNARLVKHKFIIMERITFI